MGKPVLLINDDQISNGSAISVHAWERDLQTDLVRFLVQPNDDVLELGLGLGMAYREIEKLRPKSHVVVELSADVIAFHLARRRKILGLIIGDWRDVVDGFENTSFDVVYYDADPPNLMEFDGGLEASWSFVEDAIQQCHRILRQRGRLGFLDFSCMISMDIEKKNQIRDQGYEIETKPISIHPPRECSYATSEFCHIVKLTKNRL